MSPSRQSVLSTYKRLLRASKHYPSSKRTEVTQAIREEFREKRTITGETLTKALWLAEMELKRLETWMPTAKQMRRGEDLDVKL